MVIFIIDSRLEVNDSEKQKYVSSKFNNYGERLNQVVSYLLMEVLEIKMHIT